MREDRTSDKMGKLLKLVAPGTPFRAGLDNVLRAKTGALLVAGCTEEVMAVVDGGFKIDCEFSPNYLYELAKMDGAIILNEDVSRILYANTQLIPNSAIESTETGIRHRTAERVAKQTNTLVVSISQRRNIITLYQGNVRYSLKEISVILSRANQAIQTLERYKSVLDQAYTNLGAAEFEHSVTLLEVSNVMQRAEMVRRVRDEIRRYISELGNEGRLIEMQLEELVGRSDEDMALLLKDYVREPGEETIREILSMLRKLSSEELLDHHRLIRMLGYLHLNAIMDEVANTRGFRILHRIPRLPSIIINNLIDHFGTLTYIRSASLAELDDVDGVGEVRARTIMQGLRQIEEQLFIDRHI